MSTITSTYTAHTHYVPPVYNAPSTAPSTWSQLLDLLDPEEGTYAVWEDSLSERIRDWGADALIASEEEFLENLEASKEQLEEILQDPILFIAMSRPVVVIQNVPLIGAPAHVISREASYQEDTLQFYQKYREHTSRQTESVFYAPHALARALVELLHLFPNDPPYEPLDPIVDPTSPRVNETLVLAEISSLNMAFIAHNMELQNEKMTQEERAAQAINQAASAEVQRQYEAAFQVHEQTIQASYEAFSGFLDDTKTQHEARIENATNTLEANRLATSLARRRIQETRATIRTEQERLEAIRNRVSLTIQRCQREVQEYAQATDDAVRNANRSNIGFTNNPRRR